MHPSRRSREVVFPALEVVSKREYLIWICGKPCLSPHARLQQTNKPIISTRIFRLLHPNRSFHSSLLPHPPSLVQELGTALPPDPPWSSGSLGPKHTPEPNHQHLTSYSFTSSLKTHFLPPAITTTLLPLLPLQTAPLALCDRLSFALIKTTSHQSYSPFQQLTKATPSTLRAATQRDAPPPPPPKKDMRLILLVSAMLSLGSLVASSPVMCPDVRILPFLFCLLPTPSRPVATPAFPGSKRKT